MALLLQTTLGDFTIDLFVNEVPTLCANFLKLCKIKHYNNSLVYSLEKNFIVRFGEPAAARDDEEDRSFLTVLKKKRRPLYDELVNSSCKVFPSSHFNAETGLLKEVVHPQLKHNRKGIVAMANPRRNEIGSRFYITLTDSIEYLDGKRSIIGEVVEGDLDVFDSQLISDTFTHRPLKDIRILHTLILEDPFPDAPFLKEVAASEDVRQEDRQDRRRDASSTRCASGSNRDVPCHSHDVEIRRGGGRSQSPSYRSIRDRDLQRGESRRGGDGRRDDRRRHSHHTEEYCRGRTPTDRHGRWEDRERRLSRERYSSGRSHPRSLERDVGRTHNHRYCSDRYSRRSPDREHDRRSLDGHFRRSVERHSHGSPGRHRANRHSRSPSRREYRDGGRERYANSHQSRLRPLSPVPSPPEIHSEVAENNTDAPLADSALEAEVEHLEKLAKAEAHSRAVALEMLGDLPDADMAPPDNVLFVCKLNPVTEAEDLEMIFSRFGHIASCQIIRDAKTGESLCYGFIEFETKEACEEAYFKMDNVLLDDRRIHVNFCQSVDKQWRGRYVPRANVPLPGEVKPNA